MPHLPLYIRKLTPTLLLSIEERGRSLLHVVIVDRSGLLWGGSWREEEVARDGGVVCQCNSDGC